MTTDSATPFDPAAHGWRPHGTAFTRHLGSIWTRDTADGTPTFGFVAQAHHLNPHGNVHGGMLMSFLDEALAFTIQAHTGNRAQATIQLNVQFIGAVQAGDFVTACCEIKRCGRTVAFVRGDCHVAGQVVASGDGIWKLFT